MNILYSAEAEANVLGSIIVEPNMFARLNLKKEEFFIQANQIIFDELANLGMDFNYTALIDTLRQKDLLNQIGGVAYLSKMISHSDMHLVELNAKHIKKYAIKREIDNILNDFKSNLGILKDEEILKKCSDMKNILIGAEKQVTDLFVDASVLDRKRAKQKYIKSGFPFLDTFLGGGFAPGTLTILTGTPSSGKSTIANQIVANAISEGFKAFMYSGELPNEMLIDWFSKTVVNEKDLEEKTNLIGESYFLPSDFSFEQIKKWVKDKLFVFSNSKATEENITSVIEFLAEQKDVKLFILDNLMTIEAKSSYSSDKYQKQIEIVSKVKELAKNYDLAIILVAHPNKASNISTEHNMYDVSGAAEIVNLADYCIKNIRNQDNTSSLLILKNRITGQQNKKIETFFNSKRKRFSTNAQVELKKDFGYDEKTNAVQGSFTEEDIDKDMPF